MFSRRNLRIKVMQALYSQMYNNELQLNTLNKSLLASIEQTNLLILANLYCVVRVVEFTEEDAQNQSGKFLLTEEEKKISTAIYHNPVIDQLLNNDGYKKYIDKYKPYTFIDDDIIRSLYYKLKSDKVYVEFIKADHHEIEQIKDMLNYLYGRIIYENENFTATIAENYPAWPDEHTFILKQIETAFKTGKYDIDDDAIKEAYNFAKEILETAFYNDDELTNLIKPKLKNWDVDRIASIDIILMRMCLVELLYCPNIPIKVSINEYIDISKIYSTPKSKDFINGVVDKIKNELVRDGKIVKSGRGLIQ